MRRSKAERLADAERYVIEEQRRQARRRELVDRISMLRFRVRDARRAVRERAPAIRASCRVARQRLREQIAEVRAELVRLLREERPALIKRCRNEPRAVRAAALEELSERVRELARARGYMAELRRGGEFRVIGLKRPSKRDALEVRERLDHEDHEIEVSLPDELLPAWRARKHLIEATPRTGRREMFLDWVHDHPNDAARYAHDEHEDPRVLEALVELEQREHKKASKKTKRRTRDPVMMTKRERGERDLFDRGYSDAVREMIGDGWARSTAEAFLAQTTHRADSFSRGFDQAVREYAEGAELGEQRLIVRPSDGRFAQDAGEVPF